MKPNKDTQSAIVARLPLSQVIRPQYRGQAASLARSMRQGFATMRQRSKGGRFASLFPIKVRVQAIRATLRARYGWQAEHKPLAQAAPAPCEHCGQAEWGARVDTLSKGRHTPARLVRLCFPCEGEYEAA